MSGKRMTAKGLTTVAMMAALTSVGALITVPLPFTSVPITMQVLVTLLAGAVLGPWNGALSQLIYVLVGAAGLPVFAGGAAGLPALLGPTGGYLAGFIAGSFTVGMVRGRFPRGRLYPSLGAMVAGIAVIYLFGAFQLALVAGLSVRQAVISGVLPFIGIDLAKAAVATAVARALEAQGLTFLSRGHRMTQTMSRGS